MADSFVLGDEWPDWWADMVSANTAVTHNDDGRWRGGPDHAFVIEGGAIRHYRRGETIYRTKQDPRA
ncbi:hypothetical protein [Caulobacter phage KcrB]|nr:hypothetical protein RW_GP020 [Caulobacter phage RW]WCA46324.1 hypothetical protein [Caulobacter phage KcrB]WCD56259.1 hypothetical protein [Caulobacter phage RLK]WNV48051.1 hypothetical protein GB2A_gp019 [Caulobacter phage GB2A]